MHADVRPDTASSGATIVVVGAGNIGSQTVQLVARAPAVARLVVVDRDAFEASNLTTQAIVPADVGRAKAHAAAARARAIRPSLEVEAFASPLDEVPRGVFRDADVVLGALDGREARRTLAEIAFRTGTPLLDAGVDGAALLARVTAWDPEPDAPCLQCSWGAEDDRTVAREQSLPCTGAPAAGAPTGAPAALGALAASLQVLECLKRLAARADRLPAGHEAMIDAASHVHLKSSVRRNPRCRFDHATWSITPLDAAPADLTVGDVLALPGVDGDARLAVYGPRFVTALRCAACGAGGPLALPRLRVALTARELQCAACGAPTTPSGFDLAERLDPERDDDRAPDLRHASLHALGLRPREIFSVLHAGGVSHFVLGQMRRPAVAPEADHG
jgi:adenylyltransferase/sulfurtransferase